MPTPPLRLRPVFAAAFVAGSLDLVYIAAFWALRAAVPPQAIAQSVAAGWLGREAALAGGAPTVALGLATHYAIVFAMALAPALLAPRVPRLLAHPLRGGLAYGALLYLLMNVVVAPLSAANAPLPRPGWMQASHLLAHMLLVGVPCVWAARCARDADRCTWRPRRMRTARG
ncbi:hypothetical protein LDO32_18400 [Luteimonas sp. Y-2-2-4F]|nr:hypothetical protein [Luteimonas sp. Y-2-2-4F]MCD9033686.1 hypothetical protein [Luteimonas sp. Y-2-2-4F]